MSVKVTKFGGSSLASAEQFKKVADIVLADRDRKYVVPSAPGKRFSADNKVTDLLYKCYDEFSKGQESSAFEEIKERYNLIIDGLGLDLSLDHEFELLRLSFIGRAGRDYAARRGEYLNGIILANLGGKLTLTEVSKLECQLKLNKPSDGGSPYEINDTVDG